MESPLPSAPDIGWAFSERDAYFISRKQAPEELNNLLRRRRGINCQQANKKTGDD